MHSVKSRARHMAWRDGDRTSSYNPWTRRYGSYAKNTDPEETTDLHNGTGAMRPISRGSRHSEACMDDGLTMNRELEGRDATTQFGGPKHAATFDGSEPNSAVDGKPRHDFPPVVNGGHSHHHTGRGLEDSTSTEKTLVNGNSGNPISGLQNSSTDQDGTRNRKGKGLKFWKKNKRETDGADLEKSTSRKSKNQQKLTFGSQLRAVLFPQWLTINWLLIMVPVGFACNYAHLNGVAIFVVNFIAIIPLAGILSYATEELAMHVGETLGGLLNATFGNAVELIVSILALVKNEVLIVQTSLIGSMLSNLLLVMGMCFFFGGYNRVEQFFNMTVAQTASSLLALAIGALIIPTAFHDWSDAGNNGVAPLSRGTAIILLLVYLSYLIFQLKSHASMYNEKSKKVEKRSHKHDKGATRQAIATIGAGTGAAHSGVDRNSLIDREAKNEDDDDDEETPQLTIWGALVTLGASTVCVAFCAEFMVSGISAVTCGGAVSETFVGLILLPIVGNAAEHATAVTVAIKDKMDLAIGVAVGSSMQIALLVLPFMVVLGWIMGKDDMTLYFDGFQIAILFVSILLVNYLIQDGKTHWLEGVMLMSLYIIIAVAAWFYPAKGDVCG